MFNAFFKARPRLRAALFGLAVCTPSLVVGVTAAFAQPGAQASAFVSDRLSVEVVGAGPDVILIPGFGCSREVWRTTADRLKATHRVHLVQLAGFAGEAWSHGDGPFVQPAVDELDRYIRSQGLERPAVIGHSMGALAGLVLAQQHPEAVGRLMSVDSLPFFGALRGPQATVEAMRPAADQTAQTLLALSAEPLGAAPAGSAQGRARAAQADQAWGHEYAALPGVKLIRVDGSRHFIMADQPQRFAELVDQFLAD